MNPIQEWKNLQDGSFLYRAVEFDQEESYWSRYAVNYDIRRHQGKCIENELRTVLDLLTEDMSVLEIGAGTGIITTHIAEKVKRVTVVEPSPSMIGVLDHHLERKGIKNVTVIQSKWEDADVETHDVVIAAGCLYVFYDIEKALKKMIEKAEKLLVLAHGINRHGDIYREASELMGVNPPLSGPDYINLYKVLCHMGIYGNINILRSKGEIIYDDMDHAVNIWAERMSIEQDRINILKKYLEEKVIRLPSGKLSIGSHERLNAIIWYSFADIPD